MSRYLLVLVVSFASVWSAGGVRESRESAATSGVLRSGGVDFRYVREGKGMPIVVIGSSGSYPRRWFSDELREHFEFIFVDSRHFMPSYDPDEKELEDLTLEALANDVEAVRSHLAIDKWVVLGHSVQAQIALAYAKRYPERTSHLVLVAGVPYSGPEFREIVDKFWAENASESRKERHAANRSAMASKIAAAPANRRFAINYIANAARFWADPAFDSTALWDGMETGPAFARLGDLVPSRPEVRATLESIDTPTLLILGKLDFAVPHIAWEELILDLPGITYVLIEEDSHNPMTETPHRFNRELVDWLSK